MFTFINLSILTALFAISLPLLIHLFNRQRKKKVSFSSIRFLKYLEKQRLKRLKLYEYLLIIIRSLIILMLVFAFARPTLTTKPVFSDEGARTTAVIILDSGLNMRRYDKSGNRHLRALEILSQIKKNFKTEDQVYIIPSSDPENVLNSASEVQEQQASFQSGKWGSCFQSALQLFMEHPNFNEELYIISDFQFQHNEFQQNIEQFAQAKIYFIKIGDLPVKNISIDTVEIQSQILEINKPIFLDISVKSSNLEKPHPVEIHLFVNEKRVSHRRILIAANKTEVVPMSFLPQNSGFSSGYIEISDDDFLADNRYYFVLNIPSEIKILYVDTKPSPYLLAAVQSLSNHSNISLDMSTYIAWAGYSFQKYDVIWLSNIPKLSEQIQNRLKNYLNRGSALVLMPGLNTIPSEFNILTKRLAVPIKLTEIIQTQSSQKFYTLRQPDWDHPLFNGLFRTTEPEIENPHFYRYFKTVLSDKNKRILNFQNGHPFLVHVDTEKEQIFFFSSYIDDDWTNFQYRGLFLPLLSRLMYFAVSASSQATISHRVGKPKYVTIKDHGDKSKFYLHNNGGSRTTIVPKIFDQTYQFKLSELNKPGLYKIKAEDQLISIVPVNCETNTLEEPYINIYSMKKQISQIEVFNEDQDFTENIKESRFGMELWKLFLLFSVVLILTEFILIKSMEGKHKV